MGLVPRLPRPAWLVLGGDLLSAIGSGMTAPFFVVYLHRVRGIDLTLAGFALATIAVASFFGNAAGGSLSDRFGGRRALMVGLCFGAGGASWFAFVHTAATAFGAAAVIGLGASISWPALDTLLASTVRESQRSSLFALRHATLNAGFGVGALTAAAIVDFASARSFEVLYLVDAATFVAVVPLLVALRSVGNRADAEQSNAGGYREIVADRTFIGVWALTALLVVVGYSQYEAAVPPFATSTGGVPAHGLAFVFAANTFAVALLQLPVLRALAGHRRTTAIFIASLVFGAAWCIAIAAAHVGGGDPAIVGFALSMVVLALAETMLSPALAPIVNDLAPDRLRGRYNGTFALAYTTGFMIGPALAGKGVTIGDGTPYFTFLVAGCVCAAAGSRLLRRRLVPSTDIVGDDTRASPTLQPEIA